MLVFLSDLAGPKRHNLVFSLLSLSEGLRLLPTCEHVYETTLLATVFYEDFVHCVFHGPPRPHQAVSLHPSPPWRAPTTPAGSGGLPRSRIPPAGVDRSAHSLLPAYRVALLLSPA